MDTLVLEKQDETSTTETNEKPVGYWGPVSHVRKGASVIFNSEYIEDIERHIKITEDKLKVETLSSMVTKLSKKLLMLQEKLEWAIDYQDDIDCFINVEIPSIAICKTISGLELPVKNLIFI